MCNEDRLLNRSGDVPGIGIDSLGHSDAELLALFCDESFVKELREKMKGVSDEDFHNTLAGARSSLSPQCEDEEDPDSLCRYCEELLEECACEDESE